MTSIHQPTSLGKPQVFQVPTPHGSLPLVVDADATRWLGLTRFAALLDQSPARDIMPSLDKGRHFWGHKIISGHACLPIARTNDLLSKLRFRHEQALLVAWMRNNAFEALRDFRIPEPVVPMLQVEEEPAPVVFPVATPVAAKAIAGELIHIGSALIDGQTINSVDARDLHSFLEVGTAFKDWIARRIEDFGFIEGQDFCSFLSESTGGRPSKIYALSISMAKELAMVERNDKGKQARLYFIECEKKAMNPVPSRLMTQAEMNLAQAQAILDQERKIATLAQGQAALASAVKTIYDNQEEAKRALETLPCATTEVPGITTRTLVSRVVRNFAIAHNHDYRGSWNTLYREFQERHHIDLKKRADNAGKDPLDVAEGLELIEDVYSLAIHLFKDAA